MGLAVGAAVGSVGLAVGSGVGAAVGAVGAAVVGLAVGPVRRIHGGAWACIWRHRAGRVRGSPSAVVLQGRRAPVY